MLQLAKDRITDFLKQHHIVNMTSDELPTAAEAPTVVFPSGDGSICAFNGRACLARPLRPFLRLEEDKGTDEETGKPNGYHTSSGLPAVITDLPQWASAFPRPIAHGRQRWLVSPVTDNAVMICSASSLAQGKSCLTLPEYVTVMVPNKAPPMLHTKCKGGGEYGCFAILTQTAESESLPPLEAAAPCIEACEEDDNCVGWMHSNPDKEAQKIYGRCCLKASMDDPDDVLECEPDECCISASDEMVPTPTPVSPFAVPELDPIAFPDGSFPNVNVLLTDESTLTPADPTFMTWKVMGLEDNVAQIQPATESDQGANETLCLTTALPVPEFNASRSDNTTATVWLEPCSEKSRAQMWIFSGFDDDASALATTEDHKAGASGWEHFVKPKRKKKTPPNAPVFGAAEINALRQLSVDQLETLTSFLNGISGPPDFLGVKETNKLKGLSMGEMLHVKDVLNNEKMVKKRSQAKALSAGEEPGDGAEDAGDPLNDGEESRFRFRR